MARQGKVEAFEYIADAALAANGGLAQGPKTKINIENLATAAVPDATETVKGKAELATVIEAVAGADATRIVTPAGLAAAIANNTGILTFKGIITQSGTDVPVLTPIVDTLGVTLTPTRAGVGGYRITASGNIFTLDRTLFLMGHPGVSPTSVLAVINSATELQINTAVSNTGAAADSRLVRCSVLIEVYP
ncbi:MAG: hypothetical protein V9G98_22405 [Candidatus Competibacter sp.]